ncbi:MAG TPA: ankyrin repeat domain-containing protein [Casimicrobiaceae bacterium]|nr:ankyrin repeat domain-containing protein [Casimicrobiaceae bacterium]
MCSVVRRCALLALGLAWCAPDFAQVPPTAAEYAQYTGLFAAAARNDTTRIAKLIDAGDYAGIRDSHGRTPLHVATWRRRHDAMRVLATATGDPNVLDGDGYDIVTIAAVANDVDTLRAALAIGCGPTNFVGPDDSTALIAAARRGNDQPVRALIRAGAQLDYVDKRGDTALTATITGGDGGKRHLATLKLLVAARASVNIADRSGATPLALAKARGYREMIAILETAGAQ